MFLEMNTRLQVEHPVTEMVTGIDLVEQQLLIAAGKPVSFDPRPVAPAGHAIELRVNAEDPKRFLPGPGPDHDLGGAVAARASASTPATPPGTTVTPHYDSLMAKLVVHGADRDQALAAGPRRGRRVPGRGAEEQPAVLRRAARATRSSSPVDYDTGIVGRMRAGDERVPWLDRRLMQSTSRGR